MRRAAEGESSRTIVVALGANLVIAAAKLLAGLSSRSTGMELGVTPSVAEFEFGWN